MTDLFNALIEKLEKTREWELKNQFTEEHVKRYICNIQEPLQELIIELKKQGKIITELRRIEKWNLKQGE